MRELTNDEGKRFYEQELEFRNKEILGISSISLGFFLFKIPRRLHVIIYTFKPFIYINNFLENHFTSFLKH